MLNFRRPGGLRFQGLAFMQHCVGINNPAVKSVMLSRVARRAHVSENTGMASQSEAKVERRWLSLAHSYEFAERLSNSTAPFSKRNQKKE
jgi:hypothetical protein